MKKIIWLVSLIGVMALPYGCQSHQNEDGIQKQEDQKDPPGGHLDRIEFPDKGGKSSNK